MESRIIVLGGETDTGKTLQSLLYGEDSDKTVVLDTENRVNQTISFHNLQRDIEVIDCMVCFDKTTKDHFKYQPDYYSSYLKIKEEIKRLLDDTDSFDILVIDGISPLRNQYCLAKWLVEINKGKTDKRVQPQPLEWKSINEDARQLIEPLIHMSRAKQKTVIFTVQMKDKYRKKEIIGRELDEKDWAKYNVDYIIELKRPEEDGNIIPDEYIAKCTKSIIGAWDEDLSGKRNLYELFLELGI